MHWASGCKMNTTVRVLIRIRWLINQFNLSLADIKENIKKLNGK